MSEVLTCGSARRTGAPFQLILLPGVGADHRQFGPQKSAFDDLLVPSWIPPKKNEPLADYTARLAETIPPARRMVLGGSSFGGMVAYEMAKHLQPQAVVLIGSCRSRKGMRLLVPWLRSVSFFIPEHGLDLAKRLSPMGYRVLGHLTRSHRILTPQDRELCVAMFKDADTRFMRWAFSAMLRWVPRPLQGIPVFQIHGARDLIIPVVGVEPSQIVPEGGHLINLTHAEQVNAFISEAAKATPGE